MNDGTGTDMIEQLERLIATAPGDRLPPERELARRWGVSRNEVRKALGRLELEGRLVRKVGSGTYLRPSPAEVLPDIPALQRATSPREVMEARLAIEAETARLAAMNATNDHIAAMRSLARNIRGSKSWTTYRAHDKRLHELIAEASGNKLLATIQRIIEDVRSVVWDKLDTRSPAPPADYSSFAEHDAILAAIERRDRDGAADAMRRHLRTTYDRLMG